MSSDRVRIEIAERLRKLPSDIYAAIREWEVDGLFIDADIHDEADYSQIHNAVFGVFPAEHMHPCDYEELHERLADLIDPTCKRIKKISDTGYWWECSKCGGWFVDGFSEEYCPKCGARIVEEK